MGLKTKLVVALSLGLLACAHRTRPPVLAFDWSRVAVDGQLLELRPNDDQFSVTVCGNRMAMQPFWLEGSVLVLMKMKGGSAKSIGIVKASVNVEGFPFQEEVFAYPTIRPPLGDWNVLPQPFGSELTLRWFPEGSSWEKGTGYHVRLVFQCEGRVSDVSIDCRISSRKPVLLGGTVWDR